MIHLRRLNVLRVAAKFHLFRKPFQNILRLSGKTLHVSVIVARGTTKYTHVSRSRRHCSIIPCKPPDSCPRCLAARALRTDRHAPCSAAEPARHADCRLTFPSHCSSGLRSRRLSPSTLPPECRSHTKPSRSQKAAFASRRMSPTIIPSLPRISRVGIINEINDNEDICQDSAARSGISWILKLT